MILGTVQLGINYGINNHKGKPSKEIAFDILDYAYDHGIKMLDTGPMYGNSEEIIGEYFQLKGQRFIVSTKLPDHIDNEKNPTEKEIERIISDSIKRINVDSVYCYYLHQFYQCKYTVLMDCLKECKEKGMVKYVGVSIYHPQELDYICENLNGIVDVVQIPYNIFSVHLWEKSLQSAKKQGILIFARSIFLQGLAFKSLNDEFVRRLGIEKQLEFIHNLALKRGVSIAQLCFDTVYGNEYIEDILFGCEALEQLIENVGMENKFVSISEGDIKSIKKIMESIPLDALNPQKWEEYK